VKFEKEPILLELELGAPAATFGEKTPTPLAIYGSAE
jgi:hypothetical protein